MMARVVALSVAAGVLMGCDDPERSCDELRSELASIASADGTTASWDAIVGLQKDIHKVEELRAEIGARCEGPST